MQVQDLVRAFFEDVFTNGRMDVCPRIVAPTYVEHALAPFDDQEPGAVPGPEHLKINGMIPPTGRRFASRQSHWFRVQDGLLAEHWATRDDLLTMMQLGVIPRPDGRA